MKQRLYWWWLDFDTLVRGWYNDLRCWRYITVPEWWRVNVRHAAPWSPDVRWWQQVLADRQERVRHLQAVNAPLCIIQMMQEGVDKAHAELAKFD